MSRSDRPRTHLHDVLADPERRVTWHELEADPSAWRELSDREQLALLRRAHDAELNR